MSLSRKNRQFRFEGLEDRRLMAADIRVFYNDGTLVLNEAPGHVGGNQAVMVSQLPNGRILLTGMTSPVNTVGTLVNGAGQMEVSNVRNIVVNLGGGQDHVAFANSANSANLPFQIQNVTVNTNGGGNDDDIVIFNNFKVLQSIDIETGAGRDTVQLTNTQLAPGPLLAAAKLEINTGVAAATGDADKDTVQIDRLTATCDVIIKTGASGDVVTMKNANLGTSGDHLAWFDLGVGDDSLTLGSGPNDISAVAARALRIDAGDGLDRVNMQDVFAIDGIAVQLGEGNDVLNMHNIQSRDSISLRGHGGNDTMNLTQIEAFENFFAYMGEGGDTLNITALKARSVLLDGGDGDGYDRLFLSLSPNLPALTRTGFEEINGNKLVKKGTSALPGTLAVR
jgi:hypothetical protein